MKKSIVWVAVAVISLAALCLFVGMGVKNTAISYEESIENAKGDIRNAEKRRFDLIPNLAECVKQYDEHEYKTLNDIVEARTAGDTTVSFDHVTNIVKAIVEAYPDLKSQKNYQEFMNNSLLPKTGLLSGETITTKKGRNTSVTSECSPPNRFYLLLDMRNKIMKDLNLRIRQSMHQRTFLTKCHRSN